MIGRMLSWRLRLAMAWIMSKRLSLSMLLLQEMPQHGCSGGEVGSSS